MKKKKQMLIEKFMDCNFRKLEFKVKTLALMQRQDIHFEVIYRYPLENGIHGAKEETDINDIDGY